MCESNMFTVNSNLKISSKYIYMRYLDIMMHHRTFLSFSKSYHLLANTVCNTIIATFGEVALLFNTTRTANIIALSTCIVWTINRADFSAIMTSSNKHIYVERIWIFHKFIIPRIRTRSLGLSLIN